MAPKLIFALLASNSLAALLATAQAATYSLADDFSYTVNRANSTWSYRMDDSAMKSPPVFPLLTSANRDANAVWGSDFPTPPIMWSDAAGYWGIGKNVTGRDLFSTRNGTRWAPGEVLFHPKGGDSPSGLVVCWTAPISMVIDVNYTIGRGTEQGSGIGYEIVKRSDGVDAEVVALDNIGGGLRSDLSGLVVAQGDQLFFRFHTCGVPVGDISRAAIIINGTPSAARSIAAQSSGGTVVTGSDFTFSVPASRARKFQWRKDGKPIAGATAANYRISGVKMSDAGAYSVVIDSVPGGDAILNVTPGKPRPEAYPSPTPRQEFSPTLAEQEKELQTNALMLRFAESRQKLATERFRPLYHFVSPESQMNDPNGLCFWQGRWHLFYQAYPPDEFPNPADVPKRRQHWGHAVSDDLIHCRDLPYAIYPGMERMCFSGGTVVEENRVVAFYPGIGAGQMVAVSKDPLLLNWEKIEGNPVKCPAGDSCIWKEGETFFGLVGADCLVSSKNLIDWTVHGAFLEANPFPLGDAGACPSFVPIGNKHLLLSFSHTAGGQYLLGDYDKQSHKFKPYASGRFNHGTVSPGGVHAPSAAADGKGGVININNINDAKPSSDWDQIMSLPQQLTLNRYSQLRIDPVAAVAALRGRHLQVGETLLPANQEIVLDAIEGNTMELQVEIDPQMSRWVQLNVLRSPKAEEQTSIAFYNFDRKLSIWYHTQGVLCLDGARSSSLPDVWIRPPEKAVLERGGEPIKLRVFIDRSVIEVYANGRLYLAMRVYPGRKDSVGVSLRAQGQDAVLKKMDAWQMLSIWPTSK